MNESLATSTENPANFTENPANITENTTSFTSSTSFITLVPNPYLTTSTPSSKSLEWDPISLIKIVKDRLNDLKSNHNTHIENKSADLQSSKSHLNQVESESKSTSAKTGVYQSVDNKLNIQKTTSQQKKKKNH